jgi:L,D-transpeptidase catalytic domain
MTWQFTLADDQDLESEPRPPGGTITWQQKSLSFDSGPQPKPRDLPLEVVLFAASLYALAMRSNIWLPIQLISVLLLMMASGPSGAASPMEARIAHLRSESPDAPDRMDMVRVQIFLDRANFRPGKIDGLGGEFTQKAADRYCRANNLPPGTLLDVSDVPVPYREYTVTEEDLQWIGPQASEPAEQEKLKAMLYADLWELVAEKFHCDLDFLRELNPDLPDGQFAAGTIFRVPDVAEFRIPDVIALEKQLREEEKAKKAAARARANGSASLSLSTNGGLATAAAATPSPRSPRRLELLRDERLIELYENDRLVGCFPCTPGSRQVPVPQGTWKITSNVLMPHFRWDKSVLELGVRSESAYNLPPGPNNPVGVVWMAINRPSVGMHGTPTPDRIGRNESHGCIRMANWDAFTLSQLIGKGTSVEVK